MLKLRKGLILRHLRQRRRGVVIDWGTTAGKYRGYVIDKKSADSVRVWTDRSIEVWPIREVVPE
jgi:hypothetical protein